MSEEQNNDLKKSVNDLQNDNGLEKEKKDFSKEIDSEKNISSKVSWALLAGEIRNLSGRFIFFFNSREIISQDL